MGIFLFDGQYAPTERWGIQQIDIFTASTYTISDALSSLKALYKIPSEKSSNNNQENTMQPTIFIVTLALVRIIIPVALLLTIGTLVEKRQAKNS